MDKLGGRLLGRARCFRRFNPKGFAAVDFDIGGSTRTIAALALCIAAASSHSAAADARKGEAFSQQWCAQCHAVKPNQLSPKPQAPRFSDLARHPTVDEAWLRNSLRTTPHRAMPKIKLKPEDIDNVVSYMLSLR
jgi:mono/diheme cytochrome c family protein